MKTIKDFVEQAEEFRKDPRYQTMPPALRDFFNEELGRFKLVLELSEKEEKKND